MAKRRHSRENAPSSTPPPAAEEQPAAAAPPAPPAPAKQPSWRAGLDLIGMLSLAVAAALLIKSYVIDVYLIPSGSMETALHGRPDGGDRIVSSKLSYRFRPPERWEVAVFKFPYETARRNDRYGMISPEYDGQNFVKRVVGLPGETLAIGRGDIWVRPVGAKEKFRRAVKPHSVQRGMWLKVYAEDFSDLSLSELERFWKIIGGGARLDRGGALVLAPGGGAVRMDYRPMVPVGSGRERLVELPGIPDRYVLEQPVQFRCRGILEDGSVCGQLFVEAEETQNVQARCPRCGHLADETEAVFYHRRSGLPEGGRYGAGATGAGQGEAAPRQDGYHFVPDLRVTAAFRLESRETEFAVALREDARYVQVAAGGDGRVEIRVNGRPAQPGHSVAAAVAPGGSHTLECYIVEGVVRVFLDAPDAGADPLLEARVWDDERPFPRNAPRGSGVGLSASGGEVALRDLRIDRDVFYYSGWEDDRGEKYQAMNSQGEITVGSDAFFPMGDHCPSSFDARSWGAVPLDLLLGPALFIWWPPERAGRIPAP